MARKHSGTREHRGKRAGAHDCTTLACAILVAGFLLGSWATPTWSAERFSNGYTQSESAFFRAGFWWNPQQSGWGLDLHMANGRLVAGWATYDTAGESIWYLGVGDQNSAGAWEIPLLEYHWNDGAVSWTEAGSLLIDFSDGYNATMGWQLGQRSGSVAVEAFVVDELPIAEDLTGFWYRTDEPGYGQSIATQGDKLYGVVYLYDSDGNPTWVWIDNIDTSDSGQLNAVRFTGSCPGCQTRTATSTNAGNARLGFVSENEGVWSLDVVAGPEGKMRTWQLQDALVRQLTDRASGRAERYQLQPFTNPEMLREYLIAGLHGGSNYPFVNTGVDFSPAPAGLAVETSQTNIQETGVDEADLIKSDGKYIYAVSQPDYSVDPVRQARVRVMEMAAANPSLKLLAGLEIGVDAQTIDGLYLVNRNAATQPDLLIAVLGSQQYYYFDSWFAPGPWGTSETRLVVMDISDPANIHQLTSIELDGGAVAHRRIGEQLYLVTRNASQTPTEFVGKPANELRAGITLDDLLPRWRRDGVDQGQLVALDKILLPPQPPNGRYPDMITVSAFDLTDLDAAPSSQTYTGLAETIYVSLNNLFIASSRYGYGFDPARTDTVAADFGNDVEVDLHQFALTDDGPVYRGSGAAAGQLSWGGVSPAFKFSEHDDHLRLVSTVGNWLDQYHQVSVLKLASENEQKLKLRGFVPNQQRPDWIGKPNENLHGVRFFGDRLYAVTFKKTDPFYVIDLADVDDPFIAGELELPGFSDYLHPLSDRLVLGFGKNAVPAEGGGDRDFAWFQGLQLSLFDVADPSAPSLLKRIDIGRRGSSSALLNSHHALAYLPANVETGRPARVTIPVEVADVDSGMEVSSDPTFYYPWQYTGLAMFEIDGTNGGAADLSWRDTLISHSAEMEAGQPASYDSRGLISGEHAYLYLEGMFYGGEWGQPEATGPF